MHFSHLKRYLKMKKKQQKYAEVYFKSYSLKTLSFLVMHMLFLCPTHDKMAGTLSYGQMSLLFNFPKYFEEYIVN